MRRQIFALFLIVIPFEPTRGQKFETKRVRTLGRAPPPVSDVVMNVKDKGAVGDGRTDDSAAIQAAIDAVAGTRGTVLVPDGVYRGFNAYAEPIEIVALENDCGETGFVIDRGNTKKKKKRAN